MASTEPTEWEILRFGSKFQVAKDAAVASMYQAQARALGAHLGGGARTEHAYGTQFAVAQFEELADHSRDLEGVELRKPENAKVQYELPLILETKTLLYPLRYGKDGKVKRDGAKITMSQVRRDLLHSGVARQTEKQFDLFEPLLSEEEIVRRRDAENELRAELLRSGRVVTIGIACSPDGVFDLYWGDVDVDEDTGRIHVLFSEPLTRPDAPASGKHLRVAEIATARLPRFDEESDDDGFSLTPNVEPGAVNSEKIPEIDITGSENSE